MSYLLFAPARKDRANRITCFQGAALVAAFALLLCLAACSGVSSGPNPSTTSTGGTTTTGGTTSGGTGGTTSGGTGGTKSGGGGGGGGGTTSGGTTPDLTIAATLPAGMAGASYTGSVTASGGTAPYAFAIASGQLPPGIVLAGTSGTVSGTPTQAGTFNFAISVTDSADVSTQQSFAIQVSASSSGGSLANSFPNLQQSSGWGVYGQGPPNFVDCSPSPCDGITFSMEQGISSPSMSGAAAEFDLGGTAVYSDALFNNHLIGDFSSQNMPDSNHSLVPTYHNFTYDVYFFGTNLALSQAVEFDINQFFNNQGFIWGHECRIAGGNEWDIWDNMNAHWVPTGIPCYPNSNAWNHLTIQVERTSDNQLLYQSITLNGTTSNVNVYYSPGAAVGWYGVTINYQMDGNYAQTPYSVYLDNLTFSYQ